MLKVILTKGLQASGKSSWADKMVADNPHQYKKVEKDQLRAMLDAGKWSKGNEKFVKKIRDIIILEALADGKNVIVSDTNLDKSHHEHITELVKGKAVVEIKDFTHVDLETCIARDLKRQNSVGEKVIRDTYNKYLKPKVARSLPTREHNPNIPNAVLCDIDGTLALFGDKNPYERDFINDEVNKPVKMVLDGLPDSTHVILVSGRDGKFEGETRDWLAKNNITFDMLLMRKAGDSRRDTVIKQEIFENTVENNWNVDFVIDDRPTVCRLWRQLGLPVLQVGDPHVEF